MKAPPRSMVAPEALTLLATEMICSSLSTEQGPAIMAKLPWPTFSFSSPTSMMESWGWNLRLALLNGSDTRLTPSTISSPLIRSSSSLLVSPITPMMVE